MRRLVFFVVIIFFHTCLPARQGSKQYNSPDPKNYSSTHEATGVVWDENFDAKKVDEFFKKFIAGIEKDLEK